MLNTGPDLPAYRDAVADLLLEMAGYTGPGDRSKAEKVLTERIGDTELTAVLAATPEGTDAAAQRLLREVRHYQPNVRSSARDLAAHIRIHLFALIDIMWWGQTRAYVTDSELLSSADLVDLEPFAAGRPAAVPVPVAGPRPAHPGCPGGGPAAAAGPGAAHRRAPLRPHPPGSGAAAEPAGRGPGRRGRPRTPALWVTSLARSIEHQRRLRALGYAASLPSAHCVGYAIDIEMAWFAQFGARPALEMLLLGRQQAGQVNVIDEGQAWHVCLSPEAAAGLLASATQGG